MGYRNGLRAAATLLLCAALHALTDGPAWGASPGPTAILDPPLTGGGPVRVAVGLLILNLAAVDEVAERFQCTGYLLASWKDPRLAYAPSDPARRVRSYAPNQLWRPGLELVNGAEPRKTFDIGILVHPDGQVDYAENFSAILTSTFKLRRFPFDRQRLLVVVHPFFYQAIRGEVVFVPLKPAITTAKSFADYGSLASWRVESLAALAGSSVSSRTGRQIAEIRFEVRVRRRFGFYLWKVFLPLLLMVALSWTAFWIDPLDLNNQITVAVTTVLTVIAFTFALSFTLPRVPYLTFTDAFFVTCYVFIFLAIVEVIVIHVAHKSYRTTIGLKIRSVTRWLVPAAFVATNAVLVVHFLM